MEIFFTTCICLPIPLDTFEVDKKNPDLIYFGPGIHHVEGGEFRIPSGKTVYVAGGAVMMGRMLIENVHDVKLLVGASLIRA